MTALAVGAGGMAARSARLLWRRREVRWSAPERFVQDAYLRCQRMGSGGHPVLLLHSLDGTASYFGSAFDELADPGPLLVPDLLGFGGSPASDHGYSPDSHAAALVRMLDSLMVREPVLVVGHGLGALVGLRLAAIRPRRVAALVGISPQLYRDPETARRLLRHAGVRAGAGGRSRPRPRAPRAGLAAGVVAGTLHPDLPLAVARDRRAGRGGDARLQSLRECLLDSRPAEWFPEIGCPVDLVLPAHDRSLDLALLGEIARRHPNVHLSPLGFGDFRLPLTHPDGCLAAIDRFRGGLGVQGTGPWPVAPAT